MRLVVVDWCDELTQVSDSDLHLKSSPPPLESPEATATAVRGKFKAVPNKTVLPREFLGPIAAILSYLQQLRRAIVLKPTIYTKI